MKRKELQNWEKEKKPEEDETRTEEEEEWLADAQHELCL